MENEYEIDNITEVESNAAECPNCGAPMKFSIKSGVLKCGHCGTEENISEEDKVTRRELTEDVLRHKDNWSESKVYRCDNCGAKEVLNNREITKVCPFCGSSNITSIQELSGIKPDSVIPFKISNKDAKEIFKKWFKSRKMAPKSFKHEDFREKINQIYCPVWSFSANAHTAYNGTLGRRESRQRRDSQGRVTTSYYTHWFNVHGYIYSQYTDYLIQSSNQISTVNFNQLKPFDLSQIKPYRSEYLAGIASQHYSRDLETCFTEFQNIVNIETRKKIIQKHNADEAKNLNLSTQYKEKKFNYTLLPLYIANYSYKNKLYNFFINGISGKIVGKSPISKFKVFLILLGLGSLAVLAGFLYFFFKK